MKQIFLIYGASKEYPLYNAQIGSGELEGDSMEAIVEKAKELARAPFEEQTKYLRHNEIIDVKEPIPLRLQIFAENGEYSITAKRSIFKPRNKDNSNNQNKSNMSKKQNVSEYFDNIMGGSNPSKVSNEPEEAASQQPEKRGKGRPREDGYESRTFRVKTEHVQKLKLIALKEGRLQKDILDFALESIITRYEEKHGALNVDYEPDKIENLF